jgi:protein-tyrosine phosphatase
MIDIHCHILPATDDGPRTWESTLELCERAAADGITHIVATPHCNEQYTYNRAASQAKLDELRFRFPVLGFTLGCEVLISDENLDQVLLHPELFTIGETSYMLVEVNEVYMPKTIEDALGELISSGIMPILAHPERNPTLRRKLDLLESLISMGCLAGITGNALSGFWGGDVQKVAETMLRQGLAQFLVSDGHNLKHRPVVLAEAERAAARIIGRERAHELVWTNPALIVQGEPVSA